MEYIAFPLQANIHNDGYKVDFIFC